MTVRVEISRVILFVIISTYSFLGCKGQNTNKDTYLKKSDLENDVHLGDAEIIVDEDATDFLVVDGIVLKKGEKIPDASDIINKIQIKDSIELKKLGVLDISSSYTFYNTIPTNFEKEIYLIADVPKEIRFMNLPLIINGKLIRSEDHAFDDIEVKNIRKIKFMPKMSPELLGDIRYAYGAISITY